MDRFGTIDGGLRAPSLLARLGLGLAGIILGLGFGLVEGICRFAMEDGDRFDVFRMIWSDLRVPMDC